MSHVAWHVSPLVVSWLPTGGMCVHLDGERAPKPAEADEYLVKRFAELSEAEDATIRQFGGDLFEGTLDVARAREGLGRMATRQALRDIRNHSPHQFHDGVGRVLLSAPGPGESDSSWRLPLEFMDSSSNVIPGTSFGDRDDWLLVRGAGDRATQPQLSMVAEARVLVAAVEGSDGAAWGELKRTPPSRSVHTRFVDGKKGGGATWDEVVNALKEGWQGKPFNVLAIVAHVEPGKGMYFAKVEGYSRKKAFDVVTGDRLREALEPHGPSLRTVLLCGCGSWREFGEAMAKTEVPSFVAQHAKVTPPSQIAGVRAFLGELAGGTGAIDEAFVRFRAASSAAGAPKGSPVIFLRGRNTQLVARSERTRKRIEFLEGVRSEWERVEEPGGERGRSRLDGGYVDREVKIEVVDEPPLPDGTVDEGQPDFEAEDSQAEEREQRRRERSLPQQRILEILSEGRDAWVGLKAPAGTGKTALLQQLAFDLADLALASTCGIDPRDDRRFARGTPDEEITLTSVPVYVRLRDLGKHGVQGLVQGRLQELSVKGRAPSGVRCKVTLLADGVDEISERHRKRCEDLQPSALMATVFGAGGVELSGVLVSSRPEACRHVGEPFFPQEADEWGRPESERRMFELAPWSEAEVNRYVEKNAGKSARRLADHIRDRGLEEVVGNPMMLWMLCENAKREEGKPLPETETELLESAVKRVFKRRKPDLAVEQGLAGIAEVLFQRRLEGGELGEDDAERILKSNHQMRKNDVKYCLEQSGLLLTHDDGLRRVVRCTDERFDEFLRAYHLNELIKKHGWHVKRGA